MTITIDDFKKVELRVGRILTAERVEGSGKLLRLEVDIGEENKRQILAGIGKAYAVEDIVGKEAVFVANLAPRTMMGYESQGMLLATGESAEEVVILTPQREVIPGSSIR